MSISLKSKKVIIWSSLIIILIIIIFPKLNLNDGDHGSSLKVNPGQMQIEVNAVIVAPKTLQNKIYSNGTLISNEEVELRSEISGKIREIFFEEGTQVKFNDLLVKINDSDLQATLKKHEAREILAREREYRYKQLLEKNLTSQQEYDIQLSELSSVLADIEYTQALIEKTEIRAPFNGIVGLRSVSVGSYISPQNKIASMHSINPIKLDFAVPQKYFGLIKAGKKVIVKLPSANKDYSGEVYAVEPQIDQSTRTIQARATIPNDKGELTPGAYVEVNVVLQDLRNAMLIPSEALIPDIQGEKVYLYKNGKAVPQLVQTGVRTESEIQILSGLNISDTLIVTGIIQLRPGMKIKLGEVKQQ